MTTKQITTMLLALCASLVTADAAKPNIIYILADDMGQGDVTAYNKDSKIPTPSIDRMAREGLKFMDTHTSSGVCTPTRYGILTGRYSWRTSTLKQGVLGGHSSHLIEPTRETVASLLKKQGYKTACVGKWHLGMDWKLTDESKTGNRTSYKNIDPKAPITNGPNAVGFDYYFGIAASLNMDPHAYIENDRLQGTLEILDTLDAVNARGFTQPSKPGYAAKEYIQQEVLSTFAEKTCSWIRENKDGPFFVYFPLPSPHSPIVPSDRFNNKSGLNDHGDFCMETDWVVGEVLKTLDELGIADNTLVVFAADNGTSPKAGFPAMAKQGHHSSWIYRGMKGTNWEGGHRVPFIARWPKVIKAGGVSEALSCTTDLMATCAEMVGQKLDDTAGEDSVSFLPALKGEEIPGGKNRLVIHHSDKGVFSIRSGKWKVMFDDFGGSNRGDPRKDDPIINAAQLQLFDMSTDAIEKINVAAEHPEVIDGMKKQLAGIIKNGRSTPGPNLPSDYNDPAVKWEQLSVVSEYLK
ncbi:sulfatase family protein [Pontiella sulfatireligans]|uniref:Arylsulfatase n=1 Tax=Pontiella sulfatireligans TaxID=2750658 RepID=A0A6C2UI76_9BACT|nr:arylsulfatase [Pontiella sulfatireligans]SPS74374.1 sulfatase S1_15 [Kiritimatiellales bacterium]VGO19659.1 Arylsulfatase [Pontiella sulfatireligans]